MFSRRFEGAPDSITEWERRPRSNRHSRVTQAVSHRIQVENRCCVPGPTDKEENLIQCASGAMSATQVTMAAPIGFDVSFLVLVISDVMVGPGLNMGMD
jgi:hypothetical protein